MGETADCGTLAPKAQKRQPPTVGSWRNIVYIANIENGKQNPSFDILSSILHVLPLSLDSVINPNLSEAERECRELESIYFACPPEMQKTLLDATRSLAIHLTELSEQNKNT